MSKKITFMVVDTETATLPFTSDICINAEQKKKVAIAKPLIYDIGWVITDRQGNHIDKKQYLIAETFAVPSVFNTAYYAEKRPRYIEMLERGETTVKPWNEVMEIFIEDLHKVDSVGAFNSMFDFKKAIPFTELYIKKLYSADYQKWENMQKNICMNILHDNKKKNENEFESDTFTFRGEKYKLFDIWGLATSHLLNNATYKNNCLKYGLLTSSGTYFKTSAESSYQYLCDKYDFIESHTALDDAEIEAYILSKIAKRHAITPGIKYFPFRDLGYTYDYCKRRKVPNMFECETVYKAISNYVDNKINESCEEISNYAKGLIYRLQELAEYMGIECEY